MSRKSRWMWVVVAAVVVWFVASPSDSEDQPRRTAPTAEVDRQSDTDDETDGAPGRDGKDRDPDRDPDRDRPREPRDQDEPVPPSWVVVEVIDGDTVDLDNGERVRLVGIDTPERGECGSERAADALSGLVLGRQVVLADSDEDRDQYGRLLRYVDVGGVDAGLRLVQRGLAVARYDSRDGYGFHPREPQYVAADRGSKPVCPSRPVGFAGTGGQSGGSCADGYSPCVPVYPPDVNCADVNGPVAVTGTDPHGLDGDGDGTACE